MFSLNKLLSLKSLSILTAAFLIISFTFWYGVKPIQNLVEAESLSSSPDYFITEVTVKKFDNDGLLIETIHAEQTLHYVTQSKTLLEKPDVKRLSKSGSWSSQADKGVIEDGSNDILLTENASATKKYLTSEDIFLNADSVHYLDKDQSLTSRGNATLFSTQGETSADTITTFINSEEVIMTGSVRGKYETAH